MNPGNAWNLLVFRQSARSASCAGLISSLRERIARAGTPRATAEQIATALLAAGELESALADANSPGSDSIRLITDHFARQLVGLESEQTPCPPLPVPDLLPSEVRVSPQEGFAYYCLHPADFAEPIRNCPAPDSAAVIGIRSIGTTLSAVVSTTLQAKGVRAGRITVRPTGHPYDRRTAFNPSQSAWIAAHHDLGSMFFIADEGPGISGSSFLSVGDALCSAGVPRERIVFLCTRLPDPAQLKAPDAARRWPQFRSLHVASARRPDSAEAALGGGQWRSALLPPEYPWPASWTSMERAKFLSTGCHSLLKFEGLGHYGEGPRERARMLTEADYSSRVQGVEDGFTRYQFVPGRALAAGDLTQAVLDRMADYCAFRAKAMRTDAPAADLTLMVRHNLEQEFGSIKLPAWAQITATANPVVADARMMPHDWIASENGRLLKVDATCHGEDHFFPGPADIAWDLAGAIVEWRMSSASAGYLLEQYRRSSGDQDIATRMPGYLLAYSTFRMAYCRMAAAAVPHEQEQARLLRAYGSYRRLIARHLSSAIGGHPVLDRVAAGGA